MDIFPTSTTAVCRYNPQRPTAEMLEMQRKNQDCFEKEKRKIDAARQKFRSNVGKRILTQGVITGARGALAGGIAGGAGGGALFGGVGAVPGAAIGGVVGGIFGVAGGVITGGFFVEPMRRFLYNQFDYNGALQQAKKYCDAEYPF